MKNLKNNHNLKAIFKAETSFEPEENLPAFYAYISYQKTSDLQVAIEKQNENLAAQLKRMNELINYKSGQ